jgi:hypothetical protein
VRAGQDQDHLIGVAERARHHAEPGVGGAVGQPGSGHAGHGAADHLARWRQGWPGLGEHLGDAFLAGHDHRLVGHGASSRPITSPPSRSATSATAFAPSGDAAAVICASVIRAPHDG